MQNLPLLVFDVNETLLDLDIMSPTFERIFLRIPRVMRSCRSCAAGSPFP
jgi:hypothetical protein